MGIQPTARPPRTLGSVNGKHWWATYLWLQREYGSALVLVRQLAPAGSLCGRCLKRTPSPAALIIITAPMGYWFGNSILPEFALNKRRDALIQCSQECPLEVFTQGRLRIKNHHRGENPAIHKKIGADRLTGMGTGRVAMRLVCGGVFSKLRVGQLSIAA